MLKIYNFLHLHDTHERTAAAAAAAAAAAIHMYFIKDPLLLLSYSFLTMNKLCMT